MAFSVTYRDEDGFGNKSFDDDARFRIEESGVLVTTAKGQRIQWSPSFWVSVSDDAPRTGLI